MNINERVAKQNNPPVAVWKGFGGEVQELLARSQLSLPLPYGLARPQIRGPLVPVTNPTSATTLCTLNQSNRSQERKEKNSKKSW